MKKLQMTIVAISLPLVALVIVFGLLTGGPAQAAPPVRPLNAAGDCTVITTTDTGSGSLRQCMLGLQPGATITFSTSVFPMGAPATIAVQSELPHIYTDSVTIDGSNAGVILDGSALSGPEGGLSVNGADNVVIKGLQVLNFPNGGINIGSQVGNDAINNVIGGINSTPGTGCSGNCNLISGNGFAGIHINDALSTTVIGNFIGVNLSGTAAYSNDTGINLSCGASFNVIGGNTPGKRNLISGNGNGVWLFGSDTNYNTVSGNYIGVNASGTDVISNSIGVAVSGRYNIIGGNNTSPGGNCSGECNLISGNNIDGVSLNFSDTRDNTVKGNYIGTDVSGAIALGNGSSGVALGDATTYNFIGGNTANTRNLISGNGSGIIIKEGSTNNTVKGNYIGTNADGTATLGNTEDGVGIINGQYNIIGGNNATPGGNCTGECNLISGNGDDGVGLWSNAISNTISGNYIGTDVSGTIDLGNSDSGFELRSGSSQNLIGGDTPGERNLISGNNDRGVEIDGVHYNTVGGNYIGTNAAGTTGLGNSGNGVSIRHGASHNLIGGDTSGEGNLISSNRCAGVFIANNGTNYNVVSGNYIGTNASGTGAIGQGGGDCDNDGVSIRWGARYNLVGGDNATPGGNCTGECNLISGNDHNGVAIRSLGTMSNTVSGNYVGTNITGTAAISNAVNGVHFESGAAFNISGGDTPSERNLISGNGNVGVSVVGANGQATNYNVVIGNYIGTDVNGTGALGNNGAGVAIVNGVVWGGTGAFHNRIGGSTPGEHNLIGFNQGHGVKVDHHDALYNTITQNSIHSNTDKGIELSNGGNQELFPPILTDVSTNTVEGQAPPGSTVEIFSDAEDEGRYFHGSTTADASGNFTFTQTNAFTGTNVTVTATDGDGNTSEFSSAYEPLVDVKVIAIHQPKSAGQAGEVVTPTVKIGNAGTTAETGIVVTVEANGDALNSDYGPHNKTADLPPLGLATLTFPTLIPDHSGYTYRFTATVSLAGDQDPGNDTQSQTVAVSSAVIDLWTRDHWFDNGDIPTSSFWRSPDIWVRNTDDGGMEHQDPISGTTNYVYMIVRNRGDADSNGSDTAKVYWHEPSLGIKCGDWAEIGSTNIAAIPGTIGSRLLKFSWTPTRTGHTCLHGEIVSDDDPVVHECDIPWDNNLSQRNVNIIPGGKGIDGQEIGAQASGGIAFEVTNIKDAPKPIEIIVDVSDVPDANAVRLDLGSDLAARWASVDGLAKSNGIAWTNGSIITITDSSSGTIAGIPMEASETQTVTMLVNAPSVETTTVTVYEAIDAGPGVALADAIVGGNTYVFSTESSSTYLPIILKNK